MDRCTSCQYYDRQTRGAEKNSNSGQCRRTSPELSPINQKSYMIEGVWPTVRDDDWCGEWKALVRRVDAARIADVLGKPLSAPLPGAAATLARTGTAPPPVRTPSAPPPGLTAVGRGDD